eukprot:1551608-Pyramimonas_sp.AAC.1
MNGIPATQYNPMSAAPHGRLVDVAEVTSQFDFVCLAGTGARRYGRDEIAWRSGGEVDTERRMGRGSGQQS